MFSKFFSKGDYIRNAVVLISGTGLAQVIPLVFSPVLTRIFLPADFGSLAFFMAICAITANFSTGFYELSIMLPKRDLVAFNILVLVIVLCFSAAFLLFIVFVCFGNSIGETFNSPISFRYLVLLPIGVFCTGSFQGLNYWLNRKKQYKLINACRISQSVITVGVSILLGYFGFTAYGLVVGFILGTMISVVPLAFIIYKRRGLIKKTLVLGCAKNYSKYPKLMMPTSIMNTTAGQAPVFFTNKYFTSIDVGNYSFATRILTAPVAIISAAFGQVYFQQMTEIAKKEEGGIFAAFIKTAKVLGVISILLFLPLFLWGEGLFGLIFGDQWLIAGKYLEIISIAVSIKFIVSPLSTVFHTTNNLYTVSFWQALYLTTTLALFFLFKNLEFKDLLSLYVVHEVVLYSIYLLLMIRVSRNFDKKFSLGRGLQ